MVAAFRVPSTSYDTDDRGTMNDRPTHGRFRVRLPVGMVMEAPTPAAKELPELPPVYVTGVPAVQVPVMSPVVDSIMSPKPGTETLTAEGRTVFTPL
jgi:hypothetical protein